MITFFTEPRMCLRALAPAVKSPVDSTTMVAPTEVQSISAGSFTRKTLNAFPSTEIVSSVCVTLLGRLPRIESYLSRCASVFESVISLTATISMEGSSSAARKILRPIRPKPLIPTLIDIRPPGRSDRRGQQRNYAHEFTEGDARVHNEKSQRGQSNSFTR